MSSTIGIRASIMTSPSLSAIERFLTVIDGRNYAELHRFLCTEKGFRPEFWGVNYGVLPAIHYVAGRWFETAEEADEWLSFLVVQRQENIDSVAALPFSGPAFPFADPEWMFGHTPLSCACEWGNAFGVEWLLSHGAAVGYLEEEYGLGLYSIASASSVEPLKKMLLLEKYGCNVSRNDIIETGKNRFASYEAAHEVLHYLVCERGLSVNARKNYAHMKENPLYYAFCYGSIFGVQWLITHGANVDAILGESLYENICLCPVDTLKKLRLVEERCCEISPLALFRAATLPFATSGEAHDLLHHLVVEQEMSINALDAYVDTPLHQACEFGSIFAVRWLVEHGAGVDLPNVRGSTPLMLACQSDIDRGEKVLFLSDRGADFLAEDTFGRTALFYAVHYSISNKITDMTFALSESNLSYECAISQEDLKCVLQHIVTAKGLNINSADKDGMTPLLWACSEVDYPVFAVRRLLELGANISAKTIINQNVLHLAAKNFEFILYKHVFEFLIENGADVTCKDKDGMLPYQLVRNGEIKMFLRERYDAVRFSVLRETVRPDSIKICVFGNEMAGKTTLVNSLYQLDAPPIKESDRTAGIVIRSGQIPGVGKGTTLDFGAQSTFHSAHGLLFGPSNTLFVLVLCIRKHDSVTPELNLLRIGRYWCAFIKAALRRIPSHPRSRLHLLIVGNVITWDEEKGVEANFQLKRVAQTLQKDFADTFNIAHVLEIDCSKSSSVRMNDVREKLRILRKRLLEGADYVPKLCPAIEEKLSLSEKKLECFMCLDEFYKWVADDVDVDLNEDERRISVEYLDSSGIIVNLGQRICLRPVWLCSSVIGPLLAPHYFPFGMKTDTRGIVTKEDIESSLRAFENYLKHKGTPSPFSVAVDEAMGILRYLELCYPIEDRPGVYQIPALLDDAIPADAWCKDLTIDVYRGQRYECLHSVDIISPSSFVILQCRCYHMPNVSHKVWKNGINLVKIVDDKDVECLITMGIEKGHHCIDVIVRWPSKDGCEEVAKEFVNQLKSMIAQVCDERSPGAILNWFYLDSSHLQQLSEDPAIYSSAKVDQKIRNKAVDHKLFSTRPEGKFRCRIKDLVIIVPGTGFTSDLFPADDARVSEKVMRACASVDGADWENMSVALGISQDERLDIRQTTTSIMLRRLKVLECWKRRETSATVDQLVRCLRLANVSRRAVEEKYEDLCGRK